MADENELGTNVHSEDNTVEATDLGGGWWQITAPWLEAPEKVQGEDTAKARVAELVAEADDMSEVEVDEPDDASGGAARRDGAAQGQAMRHAPRKYTGTMTKKQKKAVGLDKVKTRRILLEENDEIPPTGLFLGLNGRGYMLMPGVEADVPEPLLEILDNAVKSQPVVDPDTKQVRGWRNRMRYPYRIVR